MKKFNPKKKVWIIAPSCHGNGGWCGQRLLSSKRGMQLKSALKINPYDKYNERNDWYYLGDLAAIRICSSLDVNDGLYLFDGEEFTWKSIK